LHARFDLAYSTMGVLCWIDDAGAWMRSVASVLRPGGRLVLIDTHPLTNMVADEPPFSLDFPYAFDGAHKFDEQGSYANRDAEVAATKSVQFAHSLGEIVTAAVAAGLRIELLTEHLEATHAAREHVLTREADGLVRLRVDSKVLPILFTLIATRDSTP
jgi:SAM-dependent methyltransferase